ncbi:MAG TPA: hypothetical protein VFN18_13420 [Solirubrobacterales bacterium]|nr:hypothetical protein [Solirubrobacterales bacterium]
MAAITLSQATDLITVIGVLVGAAAVGIAYREWRHRTGHWLYVPAPNVYSQNPEKPEFWVFPPTELEDASFAVVIAGALINAGPSDAFSVRIFAKPELDWKTGMDVLEDTAEFVAKNSRVSSKPRQIFLNMLGAYKYREVFVPVLRVGDREDFVVIAKLERGDPYLEELLKLSATPELSFPWETEDKKQAHGVHAVSRTIVGRRVQFTPGDLCAPFEPDSAGIHGSNR